MKMTFLSKPLNSFILESRFLNQLLIVISNIKNREVHLQVLQTLSILLLNLKTNEWICKSNK